MPTAEKNIQLTPEEKLALAKALGEGVLAITKAWDILNAIGDRLGKDWEPMQETGSVSDIFNHVATWCEESDLEDVNAPNSALQKAVVNCFTDIADWGGN